MNHDENGNTNFNQPAMGQFEEDIESNDPHMMRILEILNDLPETEVPLSVTQRLQDALKQEGEKIRAERAAEKRIKTRKRWFKGIATAVACLVVGFVSISMYNDSGLIINQDMSEQSAASAHKDLDSKTTDSAVTDEDTALTKSAMPDDDALYGTGCAASNTGVYNAAEAKGGDTLKVCPAESRNSSTSRNALDADETPQAAGTSDAALTLESIDSEDTTKGPLMLKLAPAETEEANLALITEYLGTDDYSIVSVTQDDETGGSVYAITLVTESDGQTITKTIVLVVSEGEVYERDAAK